MIEPLPLVFAQLADKVPGVFFGLPLLALASLIFAATSAGSPDGKSRWQPGTTAGARRSRGASLQACECGVWSHRPDFWSGGL